MAQEEHHDVPLEVPQDGASEAAPRSGVTPPVPGPQGDPSLQWREPPTILETEDSGIVTNVITRHV